MRCFRQSLRAHTPQIEALESRQLLTATPQLLADIYTEESGNPRELTEFNGRMYYMASDAEHGYELWSSDGTPEGTHLVKDINPGRNSSVPSSFVASGGYLFFSASGVNTGRELWRTDGTEAGTQMVREILPGYQGGLGSSPELVEFANKLYFVPNDGTLWKSDGTEAGTVLVVELTTTLATGFSDLTVIGDSLYFLASGGQELWKSDGTAAGTQLVKAFYTGLDYPGGLLTNFDGTLYFRASDGTSTDALWKSDGTSAGTVKLDVGEDHFLSDTESLTVAGDRLYFAANSAASGNELWSTDGTVAGTQLVADLAAGTASSSPANLYAVEDTLYFTTHDGIPSLWKVDDGTSTAIRLATLEKNNLPLDVRAITDYQGELYFTTFSDVFGADLWRSDGTLTGTYPWREQIAPASTTWPFEMGTAAGKMFFVSNVGGTGMELWSSDGTQGGTQLLADLDYVDYLGSQPTEFVTAGNFVYFTANDGSGRHLFSTPGPDGPVTRLTTSAFGDQIVEVEQVVPVGDQVYFVARDIYGRRYLGISAGTPQSTRSLDWPYDAEIVALTQFDSGVMFVAHDATLGVLVCRADAEGIEVVATLDPSWTLPEGLEAVVANGIYYFVAQGTAGELWRSDGTEAGTWQVRDAVPGLGQNPTKLTATNSALYFVSDDASPALWKTDGTPAGTLEFTTVGAPARLYAAGDKLFFLAESSSANVPLGVTDGTLEGTQWVTTAFAPAVSTSPLSFAAALGDYLYFATSSPQGIALTRTDGTPEGTEVVQSILPTGSGLDMVTLGDRLYINSIFAVYESDGTADGTRVLTYTTGLTLFLPDASLATSLTRLGDTLYFRYTDPTYQVGIEPHTLTPVSSSIVGRHLFYNHSSFDGNSYALVPEDDQAIATDKSPYVAGAGLATFENISSYSGGINGVMVDIRGLVPDGLLGFFSVADFQFRVGTTNDPDSWVTAPAPWGLRTRTLSDEHGEFTRVSFGWDDGAIKNTWLEITVLANGRTGLEEPDVFYFGSRIGDTGINTPPGVFATSAADAIGARNNPGFGLGVTSRYDFNRDGMVSAADQVIARNNGGFLTRLNLPGTIAPLSTAPLALAASDDEVTPSLTTEPNLPKSVSRDRTAADRGLVFALAHEWHRRADGADDSLLEEPLLDLISAARGRRN